MNKTLLLGIVLLSMLVSESYLAQELKHCGTSEKMQHLFSTNPMFKKQYEELEKINIEEDKIAFTKGYKSTNLKAGTVYVIPVVFHIIHENGPENISDAQIFDQMRILNEDYRKLNIDISAVVPAFTSIAADCEIQFQLAKKDPLQNCTNGIDRINSSETNVGDDGSKLNPWPRSKYLNIWVVKDMANGAAGYAYYPGTPVSAAVDGVIILSEYIGSIGTGIPQRSRALTHEIGHFLNLKHLWGDTNTPGVDCTGSDNVTDTPPTMGWTTCNLSAASCSSTLDNVQNFMEYSYCSNMFTTGQKNRMRLAVESAISSRNNLWTTANLAFTGITTPAEICVADFKTDKLLNTICQGDSITFTDLSWHGKPTSWLWSFPGGTPSSSIDSMPTITYNTSGVHDVTLLVANSSGSVATTKTSYVKVNPSIPNYNASAYSEGFEGNAIPNLDWNVYNANAGSNTWKQTTVASATGTHSVCIINASTYDTFVDELISPPINVSNVSSPTLKYKIAFAKRTIDSQDKLQVYTSIDCGKNWQLIKTYTSSFLTTAGVVSTSFIPTINQWAQKSESLTGLGAANNVFIKFKFTSDAGNNIYLDDINITGMVGMDELSNNIDFNVFPNPGEDITSISFNLLEAKKTELIIYDLLGREKTSIFNGKLNAGEHQYIIAESKKLEAGVYIVKLTIDGQMFTKKLIMK